MDYDVDYDYEFAVDDEWSLPHLPDGMSKDGDLYILPNGRYLPPGAYQRTDGDTLIYEPRALSPWADMLEQCTEP